MLKGCGGFELMNCIANCRNLSTLDCAWSVKSLRANIGSQSRIYIRPIQSNLRTEPTVPDIPSEIEEMCKVCGKDVLVRNLRRHMWLCTQSVLLETSSESEGDSGVNAINESQVEAHDDQGEVRGNLSTIETADISGSEANAQVVEIQDSALEPSVDTIIEGIAKHCIEKEIVNPVEILRYFQNVFVTGRELDVSDPGQSCAGSTNFILVDRANILTTAMDEVKEITNLRQTLEVEFYGEVIGNSISLHIILVHTIT